MEINNVPFNFCNLFFLWNEWNGESSSITCDTDIGDLIIWNAVILTSNNIPNVSPSSLRVGFAHCAVKFSTSNNVPCEFITRNCNTGVLLRKLITINGVKYNFGLTLSNLLTIIANDTDLNITFNLIFVFRFYCYTLWNYIEWIACVSLIIVADINMWVLHGHICILRWRETKKKEDRSILLLLLLLLLLHQLVSLYVFLQSNRYSGDWQIIYYFFICKIICCIYIYVR